MKRLNLSEWAIRHASLVRYLMIILLIGGVWAYGKLGQKEPGVHLQGHAGARGVAGASTDDMQLQVTDRVKKS